MDQDLPSTWGQQIVNFYKKNKKTVIISCAVLVLLLIGTLVLNQKVYEISIGNKVIGNVENKEVLTEVEKELMQKHKNKQGCDIQFAQEIKVEPVRAIGKKVNTKKELLAKLDKILSVKIKAACIEIDGEKVAIVKNKKVAKDILEEVKDYYVSLVPGEPKKVEVKEEVKIAEQYVNPLEVIESQAAKDLILKGTPTEDTYELKEGDSLWTIACKHDMSVKDLLKANPQLKSEDDLLKIGDKINLAIAKPLLNVNVHTRVKFKAPIPFEVKTVKDSKLLKGKQKVKEAGKEGVKEIVVDAVYANGTKQSQTTINENKLKDPVTKVVAEGTATRSRYLAYASVASRGSGRLMWPVSGRISSPFGRRGRGYHTGIDISSPHGSPIRASNGGVVRFAGWRGGYGKLVIIDHGGGISTYYAHLSTIGVSVGQNVSRGQQIGRTGSTGRATGPHLHFEVRVNGSPKNPLNYL